MREYWELYSQIIIGVVVSLVGLLTTITGFIYTWFREGRAHRWQQEAHRLNTAHLGRQDEAISESGDRADKAYVEANQVNRKIAELQGQLQRLLVLQRKEKDGPDTH